jgi:hypothetical protein
MEITVDQTVVGAAGLIDTKDGSGLGLETHPGTVLWECKTVGVGVGIVSAHQ